MKNFSLMYSHFIVHNGELICIEENIPLSDTYTPFINTFEDAKKQLEQHVIDVMHCLNCTNCISDVLSDSYIGLYYGDEYFDLYFIWDDDLEIVANVYNRGNQEGC